WDNYIRSGGHLLAAGMSFQMIFASFAGIWVLFAVANQQFQNHPEVKAAAIDFINNQVPGLIDSNGPIYPDMLMQSGSMTGTGILAAIATVWTAIAWLDYTRSAMRRIFGLAPTTDVNVVFLKLYDLVLAIIYGVLVILSAIGSVVVTQSIDDICVALKIDPNNDVLYYALQVTAVVLVLAFDTLILGVMIRLLSGVDVPWSRLVGGALFGGAILGLLKIFATVFISKSTDNPLFASVALFIGILLWFNLSCRVFLLAASWVATAVKVRNLEAADVGWALARRNKARA
ncbi:MAG: inner membrane protein YhjD, partial [Actinomycetota bacterium]